MLKKEVAVREALETLVVSVKESETYRNYKTQEALVLQEPGLKERIDEYRRKNYEAQINLQGEELAKQVDILEDEFEEFRRNPLVDRYLSAELGFCRMIQFIEQRMEDELDFQ